LLSLFFREARLTLTWLRLSFLNLLYFDLDVLEDFTNPATAATNFMTVMARYRQNAFMQILALANNVLQKYNESPAEAKNPREKDGALVMIGALAPLILRKVEALRARALFIIWLFHLYVIFVNILSILTEMGVAS